MKFNNSKTTLFYLLAWLVPLFSFIVIPAFSKKIACQRIALFFLILLFFLITVNKNIENDLYWYASHYNYLSEGSLSDIFTRLGEPIAGVRAKVTEPVYHSLSWVLANITGSNYYIYICAIVGGVYFSSIIAVNSICNSIFLGKNKKFLALLTFLMIGITFTLVSHLVRQYIAGAIFFIGLAFFIKEDYRVALLAFLVASLTHNSVLLLCFLSVGMFVLYKIAFKKRLGLLVYASVFGAVYSLVVQFAISKYGDSNRLFIDDGSVSTIIKFFDAVLLIGSLLIFNSLRRENISRPLIKLFLVYFIFYFFLLFAQISPFLHLRYYFYMDFLRVVPLVLIFHILKLGCRSYNFVVFLILIFGFCYLWLRIDSSPFDFGEDLLYYLFFPISKFLYY